MGWPLITHWRRALTTLTLWVAFPGILTGHSYQGTQPATRRCRCAAFAGTYALQTLSIDLTPDVLAPLLRDNAAPATLETLADVLRANGAKVELARISPTKLAELSRGGKLVIVPCDTADDHEHLETLLRVEGGRGHFMAPVAAARELGGFSRLWDGRALVVHGRTFFQGALSPKALASYPVLLVLGLVVGWSGTPLARRLYARTLAARER